MKWTKRVRKMFRCRTNEDVDNERRLDYNEILEHLGPFGLWQKIQILFLFFSTLSAGVAVVAFAFTAYVPRYRCRVPNCESDDASAYVDPKTGEHFEFVKTAIGTMPSLSQKTIDELGQTCKYLIFDNSSTCPYNGSNVTTWNSAPAEMTCSQDDLIFDQSIVKTSLVSHFRFTCDRFFLRSFFNALYMAGMLIGSFVIGLISDHFGRRNALTVSAILVSGAGTLTAFVEDDIVAFAFLRILTGMGGMGCYMVAYVTAAESTLPSYTVTFTTLVGSGFAMGELALSLEAYLVREWKKLQLVAYAPVFILIGLRIIVPESTRWLIAKGRNEEAREQIKIGERLNGTRVPEELLLGKVTSSVSLDENVSGELRKPNLFDLFRPFPMARRTLNMSLQWFSVTMVYYGLSFASTSFSGDPYLNFALTVIAELPSIPFGYFVVNRSGRRHLLIFMQLLSGICCIIAGLLMDVLPLLDATSSGHLQKFQVFLSMLGKFGATSTFGLVYLYTSELYPTVIRNSALGTCSCFARIGGILSLLMGSLGQTWKPFPMVIMGTFATMSGVLACLFPETTGKKLPETIEDALNLGQPSDKSLCRCIKRSDAEPSDINFNDL